MTPESTRKDRHMATREAVTHKVYWQGWGAESYGEPGDLYGSSVCGVEVTIADFRMGVSSIPDTVTCKRCLKMGWVDDPEATTGARKEKIMTDNEYSLTIKLATLRNAKELLNIYPTTHSPHLRLAIEHLVDEIRIIREKLYKGIRPMPPKG